MISVVPYLFVALLPGRLPAEESVFHQENVLGTSAEVRVVAESHEEAQRVEAAAMREIDRLDAILSSYREDSEFSRWQDGQLAAEDLSPELNRVLAAAEHWREVSGGAFDTQAAEWSQLWQQAAQRQSFPTSPERQAVQQTIADRQGIVRLDGLAKGFVLDAVCEAIQRDFPQIDHFCINIGGDLRRLGQRPLEVGITDPIRTAENDAVVSRFTSTSPMAVATSGGYRRGFELRGRQLSHIVDPRTGWPVERILSASVMAADGMTADALATTLNVLDPQDGLRLVASLDQTECCLVTSDGRVWSSDGWPGQTPPQTIRTSELTHATAVFLPTRLDEKEAAAKSDKVEDESGLMIEFELQRPSGRRYRRPYFAIWLEDEDGFPVKTGVLWMQTEQPGPRWHRDLTRWYRNDRMRKLVEDKELIGTVSGATRGPGKYKARFDGTDNTGDQLPKGKYTLCIEAAREHGTYQIVRKVLELGDKPIARTSLKGNVEVGGLALRYTPWEKAAETKQDTDGK